MISRCLFILILITASGCTGKTTYYQEAPQTLPEKPVIEKAPTKWTVIPEIEIDGPLVIVDPGHGGKDNGTASIKGPKYYEKDLALSTSMHVAEYLRMLGFKTLMTRSIDEFIELKDRAQLANTKKPIAFVSIHFNSAPSKEAAGVEVYYYNSEKDKPRAKNSKLLAAKVLEGILAYTKAKSRGVKHGNFLVIRETDVPAIIVEGGFMTNEEEMQKIRDAAYLKKMAYGIAQGVKKFAATKH